jgi:hypothetical protein
MTDTLVFHSSFDSTRFTAVHPVDFPNLAQAQAEAVVSLLLGRSLVVNNTYAFDSRSVLNLIAAILDARNRASKNASAGRKERIDAASPLILRWYAPAGSGMDFFACCADQLRRLEPGTRFILSHWKAIDDQDEARRELAAALTSGTAHAPPAIRDQGELADSFETLRLLNEYVASPGRGGPSGGPQIGLLDYLTDFEQLDNAELGRLVAAMSYPIGMDGAAHLRESIRKITPETKKNRGWAHDAVNQAGGEKECEPFLLEQRQLIDTLYNAVLADSVGSGSEFLSSVPRTVNNDNLKVVNGLALELIRYSKSRRGEAGPAGQRPAGAIVLAPAMSGLFVAAAEEPDLPAAPLATLLDAYWDIIADDDLSQVWRDSCAHLEDALREAERLSLAGRSAGSELSECWEAHLDTLHARLPHIQAREKRLGAAIQLGAQAYCQLNLLNEADRLDQAKSLATGEYIDRLRRVG